MLLSKSLAAALCLLSASTLAAAQSLPFLQRELADRSSRFLELAQPPGASPAYRAHIGSQTVTFDASGVQWVPPTSEPSSLLKGIGVHAGLSYRFEGGATNVPEVLNPSNTTYNWFVGPQSEWREGLKSFGELAYRNVWPGIDTVFKGDFKGVKYQFELARGVDPARVWLRIAGAHRRGWSARVDRQRRRAARRRTHCLSNRGRCAKPCDGRLSAGAGGRKHLARRLSIGCVRPAATAGDRPGLDRLFWARGR